MNIQIVEQKNPGLLEFLKILNIYWKFLPFDVNESQNTKAFTSLHNFIMKYVHDTCHVQDNVSLLWQDEYWYKVIIHSILKPQKYFSFLPSIDHV